MKSNKSNPVIIKDFQEDPNQPSIIKILTILEKLIISNLTTIYKINKIKSQTTSKNLKKILNMRNNRKNLIKHIHRRES